MQLSRDQTPNAATQYEVRKLDEPGTGEWTDIDSMTANAIAQVDDHIQPKYQDLLIRQNISQCVNVVRQVFK